MDASVLEDLGLTQSEIKVYICLLKLGHSYAGGLIDKTNLQSSVIFRALNSLIEKGLINFVLEGKKKIYRATDPENFHQFIDEKRERFNSILPQLKKYQNLSPSSRAATLYKGMRGIKEVYRILRETKGEYNSFGGGRDCEICLGETWWKNHHQKRRANKQKARQVFDETVRNTGEYERKLPLTKIKFLDASFASFQETVIVGDMVAITVFTKDPYSFLIDDKFVSQSYKKHFEFLWKSAIE